MRRLKRLSSLTALPAIAAAFVGLASFWSCNDIGCTELRSSIPLAGFYSSATQSQIAVDSILLGGIGAPHDSLLVDASDRTTSLYLPFRAGKTSTSFFIRYVSRNLDFFSITDTITFSYTSQPYFASADCGAMFVYRINSVSHTRHIVDSIAVTDSLINNQDMERIKIFFRTTSTTAEP